MTAAELRRHIATAEYHSQRDLAQEVVCPDCKARIGDPCTSRSGDVLRMEHGNRITKAEDFRRRGIKECVACARQDSPWPSPLVLCAGCRRICDEIKEADEMAKNMDAAQWDGHLERHYTRLIKAGRSEAYAKKWAHQQTAELFGPRPEEIA